MPSHNFTVSRSVGRVLEARVFDLRTTADAEQYARAIYLAARGELGTKAVLLADHRPVRVYPAEVADHLVLLFTTMNMQLERASLLALRDNAVLSLQLQRLVREAQYDPRRVFFDPAAALEHLAPALNADENRRVAAFVAEWPPA